MGNEDFVKDFRRQWREQVERIKNQTTAQRLQTINEQVEAFEMPYGGTFQDLFGHLSELEIDRLSEAVDVSDWRELLDQRQRLLDMTLRTERVRSREGQSI
jgi:hypothetical protein